MDRGRPSLHAACVHVALALVVVASFLTACTDDKSDAGEPATTTRPRGVNTEALHAFLEKAAAGKKAVFSATYAVELPGTAIPEGTLGLAQDGERRMSELVGADNAPSLGFYDTGAGTIACATTRGTADWECYRTEGDATQAPLVIDIEDLYRIQDQFRPAQNWYAFETSDTEMAGTTATCLAVSALPGIPAETRQRVGESATLCLSESGAPLVVDVRGSDNEIVVKATGYRGEVADDDFQPPAPVQEGPPNVLVPAPPEEVPQGESAE
ncbi:MAG: hypothetical protein IT198_09065 [Acidimicrobiia bacterium]|nr:hypothetical protein [Acidimicrobiia bacterium]